MAGEMWKLRDSEILLRSFYRKLKSKYANKMMVTSTPQETRQSKKGKFQTLKKKLGKS